jgi:aminopeptidase N
MTTSGRTSGRCGGAHGSHSHFDQYEQEEAAGEARTFAAGRPFTLGEDRRPRFERDQPFRITHLALSAKLSLTDKSIQATATLDVVRASPVATSMPLDAIAFDLHKVDVDGVRVECTYDGRVLSVPLGKKKAAKITVGYTAVPRKGLYFLEPDAEVKNRPRQVWSQCQEEDARHFVPCHDAPHEKMTTEMSIAVPKGYYVLSNGALISRKPEKGGLERFHWRMNEPHPSYLLTLVAGEFAEIEDMAGKVPLSYLVPKGREEDARRTFGNTKQMIARFGELTGQPYPWNRYAQVVVSDFIFGGMENTTATTLYEHVLIDKRAALDITSEDLVAHELAHQWFGDFLTCRDWAEGWLNEGFATYFEHLWREHKDGHDEYEYGLLTDLQAYLGEAAGRYKRPMVCRDYDAPLDLFDRHLYEKGSLTLHALRMELGDDTFFAGIKKYVATHAKGVVETRDLRAALESVSGRSLGAMFNELVYTAGHPELTVDVSWADGVLSVSAKQSQEAKDGVIAAFTVPIELALVDAQKKSHVRTIVLDSRANTFALPCTKRPAFVVVDPRMRILGDVNVNVPDDMAREQLGTAHTARGRWRAAQALAKRNDLLSIRALGHALNREKEAWMVRAEAAHALGTIKSPESEALLIPALATKHPKVRRAVAAALGVHRSKAAAKTLARLAKSDPSYLVCAEAARALGKTRDPIAKDTLLAVVDHPSWADVIGAAAADALGALRTDDVIPELLKRTKYGQPTRLRRAAIWALAQLTQEPRVRETIEELLTDKDPYLRIDVVRALVEIGDVRSRGKLLAVLDTDLDPRVRRRIREALRDLGRDEKKVARELTGRIERIEKDYAELRAQLQKLTAKGRRH